MEAHNKESTVEELVKISWAQRRSNLREKSMVGKFVRNSLQTLSHNDVLLKLKTSIQNCKGHAQASAQGLRAIMETMLYGSHFMLFKKHFTFTVRLLKLTKMRKLSGTFYFIQIP